MSKKNDIVDFGGTISLVKKYQRYWDEPTIFDKISVFNEGGTIELTVDDLNIYIQKNWIKYNEDEPFVVFDNKILSESDLDRIKNKKYIIMANYDDILDTDDTEETDNGEEERVVELISNLPFDKKISVDDIEKYTLDEFNQDSFNKEYLEPEKKLQCIIRKIINDDKEISSSDIKLKVQREFYDNDSTAGRWNIEVYKGEELQRNIIANSMYLQNGEYYILSPENNTNEIYVKVPIAANKEAVCLLFKGQSDKIIKQKVNNVGLIVGSIDVYNYLTLDDKVNKLKSDTKKYVFDKINKCIEKYKEYNGLIIVPRVRIDQYKNQDNFVLVSDEYCTKGTVNDTINKSFKIEIAGNSVNYHDGENIIKADLTESAE